MVYEEAHEEIISEIDSIYPTASAQITPRRARHKLARQIIYWVF
jgi:hypothetical protein